MYLPSSTRSGIWRYGRLALAWYLTGLCGCTWISRVGSDPHGAAIGKTFYVGGAGVFGHVGTIDVPKGLRQGGYRGAIEVFGWQSWVGGTLRDQVDRQRNGAQAQRLAKAIRQHLAHHPGTRVNIIALSAGTGVATWALEELRDECRVGTVVLLSSSLSRHYDLSDALSAIDGLLYCFYSPADPILRYGVPISGSVDREFEGPSVAGLFGFALPTDADDTTRSLYQRRLRNMPHRRLYARHGYRGLHTDGTSPDFIASFVAPLLAGPLQRGDTGAADEPPRAAPLTSQPASQPARQPP
ncbi:MAG: alpha/beta hydrolase [Planctomycetes bacterium]|nr:alpha/beta hydrolase [Planctomycetota bacterium]